VETRTIWLAGDVDIDAVAEANLLSRSSSADSSSLYHQLRQSTPTPTPNDDTVAARAVSSPKDASSMDAGKSTVWLGTEDGW